MNYPIDPWILRYYLLGELGPVGRVKSVATYIQNSEHPEILIAANRLCMDVENAVQNFLENPLIAGLEELCAANKKAAKK